ncbi:MAG: hypothetical protein RLZZ127_614 [Planctomycetota bacterium]|jgi:allophanate hydrolase
MTHWTLSDCAGRDPRALVSEAFDRIIAWGDGAMCISLRDRTEVVAAAGLVDARLPLAGVPFLVKDNIDVAGLPTTAGCPSFAYRPERDAVAVARLVAAGAVPIGKTNLDQFATGLVGVRSPYGVPRNPLVPGRIPGGSSSGSATAVAAGCVPFALGTDTAGSGRVPAMMTGICGLKPTPGLVSTGGVVPAVRSIDTVSVFAAEAEDAFAIGDLIAGFDAGDPFSRRAPPCPPLPGRWRVGVLDERWLGACTPAVRAAYHAAVERAAVLGWEPVAVDFAPFMACAASLYGGAWVAERTATVGGFLDQCPPDADPTVAGIIRAGSRLDAVTAHRDRWSLMAHRRDAEAAWAACDLLLLPTAPCVPTIDEVRADPVGVNSRLGTFTNFANLLDTAAVALPAGRDGDGLPSGITLVAQAFREPWLRAAAAAWRIRPAPPAIGHRLAVAGAHLRGLPLHGQLLGCGAVFESETRTAPCYRMVRLPGTPARPGLVRTEAGGGAIAVEVYRIGDEGLGRFLAGIPAPLGLGRLRLEDGSEVIGFLCEAVAAAGCEDLTARGGWRAVVAG